jgi:hypothetical protein
MDACITANLDAWKWENGEYPSQFMAKIVAWYRGKTLVKIHSDDAVSRASKKKRR